MRNKGKETTMKVPRSAVAISLFLALFSLPAIAGAADCHGKQATIEGSPESDTISGTGKDDVILGFGGEDKIFGKGGDDTICGGGEADFLVGGPGDDLVDGQSQRDTIAGGPDNDVLLGPGPGDILTFADAAGPVEANLRRGVSSGEGEDELEGFRKVIGSPFADVLKGSSGRNYIDGGRGADKLVGLAQADSLEGGPGNDKLVGGGTVRRAPNRAVYTHADQGVVVNLVKNVAHGEGEDVLKDIEGVTGSSFADELLGDEDDNVLTDAKSTSDEHLDNDLLRGRGGDDEFDLTEGEDRGYGGSGRDHFWDEGGGTDSGGRDVYKGGPGPDFLHTSGESETFPRDQDTDVLVGGPGVDGLEGGFGPAVIRGGGGDDLLRGKDTVKTEIVADGGPGDDYLLGSFADDSLTGGPGDDEADGRDGEDACEAETEENCEQDP
jgi:Ca2+-binding RTX toxin-like protein